IAEVCASEPRCPREANGTREPLAPTLARHAGPDLFGTRARARLRRWAEENLPRRADADPQHLDLLRPADTPADVVATLLYPVTDWPFRELYELARSWSAGRRAEILDVALQDRGSRNDLPAGFQGGLYAYDLVIDIGAYRDLHRHRRCHKFRQDYS